MMIALFISTFAFADDDETPAKDSFSNAPKASASGGNYSFGLGPIGNIFVVDSNPELSPGVGGFVFFDYRWSPQFSTQFSFLISMEDGKGRSKGDDNIDFFGIPTFDLKFFVLSTPSRWDPYGLVGVGIFLINEGSQNNGTKAFGIGADLGLGTDFYITEKFSVGLTAIFRSIGFIDSTSSGQNGTSLFPLSLMGNLAYHF